MIAHTTMNRFTDGKVSEYDSDQLFFRRNH